MKALNPLILLIFSSTLLVPQQPSHASNTCSVAIDTVKDEIHGIAFFVDSVSVKANPKSPFRHNQEVTIFLGDNPPSRKPRDSHLSPEMMRDLADSIITQCEPVVRVTFGTTDSNWTHSFSYRQGIGVTSDDCRYDTAELQWGQMVCGQFIDEPD